MEKELSNISQRLNDICLELQNIQGLNEGQEGCIQSYVEIISTISEGLTKFKWFSYKSETGYIITMFARFLSMKNISTTTMKIIIFGLYCVFFACMDNLDKSQLRGKYEGKR